MGKSKPVDRQPLRPLSALLAAVGTADYIYGPSGTPVEQIALSTSTPTYLTYTASDSTWLSTNQAGDETGFWGYDAYGTLAFGTPTSPFGYSGQYVDATTGLVNDRARWYEPQDGGFTTRDPAFASTDTAYTYANGDPVNNLDPSGLWSVGGVISDVEKVAERGVGDLVGAGEEVAGGVAEGFAGALAGAAAIGVGLGVAVSVVWDALGPAPSAGGNVDVPIWFGQPRISEYSGDGIPVWSPPNGVQIPVFPWAVDGQPVAVAIGNRRLAAYSLADVTDPPYKWQAPTSNQVARLNGVSLANGGPLPNPQILVTPNINCDTPVTTIPGAPDGIITSTAFVQLAE
jgi:RHS repeat-associated protein